MERGAIWKDMNFILRVKKIIDLEDDENIDEYVNNIVEGNDEEDGYHDLDELLNDMEYETLNYRKIVC